MLAKGVPGVMSLHPSLYVSFKDIILKLYTKHICVQNVIRLTDIFY